MAQVQHQVGIVGDIHKIFCALHQPEELMGWWATTAEGSPLMGETLHLHFSDVVTLSFKIVELKEHARVQLHCIAGPGAWQDCDLTFSLKLDTDQVWINLVHKNDAASDEDFLYFNTKWPCYLLSLKDWIEIGQGRPYPNDVKIHLGD